MKQINCYRSIALKLLIISKTISDKSFSVLEGCYTGLPYVLSVEALKLRQGQLHFFEWNLVFFFDEIITNFNTLTAVSPVFG